MDLSWLPAFVVVFTHLFGAHEFGVRLFPRERRLVATAAALPVLVAAQSLLQTAVYYAGGRLGTATDLVTAIAAVIIVGAWCWRSAPDPADRADHAGHAILFWLDALLLLVAALAAFFVLRHAALAATTDAIRTPWPLLAGGTFAALALLSVCAWIAGMRERRSSVWIAALALGAVTLIATLVYRLGFGFDGFLHRASEAIILATGTLQPKPPYYIGQYVFVTWLARLFQLPLRPLDLFLVPLGAAFLPFAVRLGLRERATYALPALAALLPFAPFVATTPQSLAYLLGIAAVCLAADQQSTRIHPSAPLLLAAWSLATHPLAGLPFAGAVLALLLQKRQWLLPFIILATAASVPFAFYANSQRSSAAVTWNLSRLATSDTWNAVATTFNAPATHLALWADGAAFVGFALPWALLLLGLFACWLDRERRGVWSILIALGLGMHAAGLALKAAGEFAFLIDYERGNYADRVFLIGQFFWLLPAASGLGILMKRSWKASWIGGTGLLLATLGWTAANAYNALPKHDAATVGHGWSVSAADQEAVRWIEQDAGGKPYVVLANQSVSAAAVEAYGFKRYARNAESGEDVFYYPIPTGGSLYQLFLRATGEDPSRETAREAGRLGKGERVYVVLNSYWWDADRVGEQLKTGSDAERDFGNGQDRVYVFDLTKDARR